MSWYTRFKPDGCAVKAKTVMGRPASEHLPSEYPRRRDVSQPLWYLGYVRKMYTFFGRGS